MLCVAWARRMEMGIAVMALLAAPALAQKGGSGGGGTGAGSRTPSVATAPPQVGTPTLTQPIVISGKVQTDDGSPVPREIVIERVCYGHIHQETRTDATGGFSFQLGAPPEILPDVTVSGSGMLPDGQQFGTSISGIMRSNSAAGLDPRLANCELRANVGGYHSTSIDLARFQNNFMIDIGTIFLQHGEQAQGTTVSVISLQAPKEARKAFQKGIEAAKKGKTEDGTKQLQKAVTIYPRYAEAWFQLGQLLRRQNQLAAAKNAYSQAIAADSNFVVPYFALAEMALQESRWSDVLQMTSRALQLDSMDFPAGYYYDAVANYMLGNLPQAEKSALQAQRLDQQNLVPRVHLLLASIFSSRKDYPSAIAQVKTYLALAPNASDAPALRSKILDLEKLSASATQPAAAPNVKPN